MKITRLLQGGALGLAAAVVAIVLWQAGLLEGLEQVAWAYRVSWFAPRSQPCPQVKVILLDQPTLDWGKKENGWAWPWPRTVYGAVLDFCRRAGAKAVAFDVLYTEPSAYEAADDQVFGDAIRKTPSFVGAVMLGARSGEATNWPGSIRSPGLEIAGLEAWLARHRAEDVTLPKAAFPIAEVATNSAMLANVSDQPDADGQFRRASLFRIFGGKPVPALSLAAYLASEKTAGRQPPLRIEKGWLRIGDRRIPINDRASAILAFRGRNGTHETYSAAAVIQSELRLQAGEKPVIDPAVFTNAFVFFGFSAPGLMDLRPTPLSRVYPGVEIHATALDNFLSTRFLRDAPAGLVVALTLILGSLSGAIVTMSRNARQTVLAFGSLLVPLLASFAAYPMGWWLPAVVMTLAVAIALVAGVVLNYATEGRQRAFLKNAFKHYLGNDVIDQIVADPSRLRLGGEKRELSIFFSDIEKFSSFSEKLDPETLTGLLNDYLTDMTNIIIEEGGYLDKYIGDAIVAFWNAPATQSDHAIRAVRALLRCQRMLNERRAQYQQKTGVVVKARIGMNSGTVTVGNMGSRDRFNYTILGDAANLASRLEGANKVFGTYNMISEMTWSQTQGQFVGRELGRIRVVGREQPVRIYEAIGFAGEPLPGFVKDFEEGLGLCREGRWLEALERFQRHPEDPPSVAYVALCKARAQGPAGPWDGIWNMTEK